MKLRWIVLLVVALVASACSGAVENLAERAAEQALESEGGGDVDIDLDEGSFNIDVEGEDGSSMQFGQSVEIPAALTIPVPDGGTATTAGTDGSYVFVSLHYPKDRFDGIVAFYDEWTDGTGDEWQRSESTLDMGDAGIQRSVMWIDGATAITVNYCFTFESSGDELDHTCVTVNESQ